MDSPINGVVAALVTGAARPNTVLERIDYRNNASTVGIELNDKH
jgi:hypothetical protein